MASNEKHLYQAEIYVYNYRAGSKKDIRRFYFITDKELHDSTEQAEYLYEHFPTKSQGLQGNGAYGAYSKSDYTKSDIEHVCKISEDDFDFIQERHGSTINEDTVFEKNPQPLMFQEIRAQLINAFDGAQKSESKSITLFSAVGHVKQDGDIALFRQQLNRCKNPSSVEELIGQYGRGAQHQYVSRTLSSKIDAVSAKLDELIPNKEIAMNIKGAMH